MPVGLFYYYFSTYKIGIGYQNLLLLDVLDCFIIIALHTK